MLRRSLAPLARSSRPSIRPLLIAALLLGCGSDPSEPQPHEGVDRIVFTVHRSDPDGVEMVVWRGTTDGPLPGSPESTPVPWVGFGQPFRVEWQATSANAPIVGTRIRASNTPGAPYLAIGAPAGATWGPGTSFTFANSIPATELGGDPCDTGPDCPDQVRMAAGACSLRVQAIDDEGQQLDSSLGSLHYRVNFPPQANWVIESPVEAREPYWTAPTLEGSEMRRAYVEGDTIPSGARLHLVLAGRDRLFGSVDPDSACCDLRLDEQVPPLRFQARAYGERRLSPTLFETRQTVFGSLSPDSVLSMLVGAFDYRLDGRAADEHLERSAPSTFSFIGGLPPRLTEMQPHAELSIEVLPPNQPIPTGEDGPLYSVVRGERRWDSMLLDWSEISGPGQLWQGNLYRIPLRLRTAPHPLVAPLSPTPAGGLSDHVRSFAYELVGEFDPFNRRNNGIGDDLEYFVDATGFGSLDLEDARGYELFVPDVFWEEPSWFAPELVGESECLLPEFATFCLIGDRIRSDLGRFAFRALGNSSTLRTSFPFLSPLPADSTGVEIPLEYARFATRTAVGEQGFSVRLRPSVEGESVPWPAPPIAAR
jgi:hypothetical protein